MKKIFFLSFLAISILSCKEEKSNENIEIKSESEQLTFYKSLLLSDIVKNLKEAFPEKFENQSDAVVEKIAKIQMENSFVSESNLNDTIYLASNTKITYKEQLAKVDSLYYNNGKYLEEIYDLFLDSYGAQLKELSFNDNIITLFWAPGQTGPSSHYQKLLLTDNDVIDLGNGLKLLTNEEKEAILNKVKSQGINNFNLNTEPNRVDVSIVKGSNSVYSIDYASYDEEDLGCCPSILISFKTNDFKNILPNTLKIEKQRF